jgi:hypothetical protein
MQWKSTSRDMINQKSLSACDLLDRLIFIYQKYTQDNPVISVFYTFIQTYAYKETYVIIALGGGQH